MDQHYLKGMERLVAAIQDLSRARDIASVQAIVRKAARELTGADGATFVLRDGDQCFYADEDAIEPLWKGQRFPMTACISGWTMLNGKPAVIDDIYADARIPADAYRPTFVKSLVMVPVRTADPIAAIGNYWATSRLPSDVEVKLLQALADSTSVALENAQLYSELEARIRERTAALEVLAGGVANDFNNLLSVIMSYSSMTVSALAEGDPLRHDIEQVYKAGVRAASLTNRLLAFSRRQILDPKVLDVGAVARGMEMMLHRLVGSHVQFELDVSADLFPVFADASSLEQVLMNLVVNARDAMPEGGKLTVEVTNVHLAGEYTSADLGGADGDYVMLAVSDTGTGMSKETQARIFEPFFTTKEPGKGTGLGLSTVYGIVKQSEGHIWVYSELGEGTTFKVYLPRSKADVRRKAVPAAVVTKLTGRETVLLVEDDEQVRAVVRGILRRHGYHVIATETASDAIAFCRARPEKVDLLLTDVIMPQMNGLELIDTLAAIRPAMKVICMSGYTGEAAVRLGIVESNLAFVQKPLTPETLLLKVRQVLDEEVAKAS